MNFQQRLKELRIELALSQKDVADGANVSPQCISQLESGQRSPTGYTLALLANFFECSIDYLMGREDDKGSISVYHGENNLTVSENKIITLIRKNNPISIDEFISMYCELPFYLQERIFAELKGAHLGYTVSKNQKFKEK